MLFEQLWWEDFGSVGAVCPLPATHLICRRGQDFTRVTLLTLSALSLMLLFVHHLSCGSAKDAVEEGVQQGAVGCLKPLGKWSPRFAHQFTAQRPCVRGGLREARRKGVCAVDGSAQIHGSATARRCLLPWDCLSSCNLCPVIENHYKQNEE